MSHCECGSPATASCSFCGDDVCGVHSATCGDCGDVNCGNCLRAYPASATYSCISCVEANVATQGTIVACPFTIDRSTPDPNALNYFVPPIVLMTFAQSRAMSKNKTRPPGKQAEHIIPNSCFIRGSGRTGLIIPGGAKYSEGAALTYFVDDDQSHGTEHKFLTNCERAFADYCVTQNKYPTLRDWLNYMEAKTAESIAAHRTLAPHAAHLDPGDASRAAAKALFAQTTHHFVHTLGMNLDTPLAHGIVRSAQKVPTKTSFFRIFDV